MLRFPVHPRLGRMLVEGEDLGVAEDAATLAALIAERDIRDRGERGRSRNPAVGQRGGRVSDGGIDLVALLELFEQARASRFSPNRLRTLGLDPRATAVAEQARRQLSTLVRGSNDNRRLAPSDRGTLDRLLARATLAGFPDRVARRRGVGSRTVVLAGGGTAEVAYEPDSDFIVALDAEDRPTPNGGSARAGMTTVRLGCAIDPDWLGELEGGELRASDVLEFDSKNRTGRRAFAADLWSAGSG